MSITSPVPRRLDGERRPGAVTVLAVLLALLAVGALQGGIVMLGDPQHAFGMTTEVLARAPVDDFALPGLFLIGVGVASALAAAGFLLGWRWRWAAPLERRIGYRWPWAATIAVGVLLLAFETAELLLIPFHPVLHPLFIACSLAIVALAWAVQRRYAVSHDDPYRALVRLGD